MKILGEGKFLKLVQEDRWEYVQRSNCTEIVSILPLTEDQKIIFTEQYRMALKKWVIEFPAGLVGDQSLHADESLIEAAQRELREEVGYEAKTFTLLFQGPPSAGLSSEIIYFYKATGLKKVGSGGGDGTEKITVHKVALAEIDAFLEKKTKEGRLIDPKFYAGLYFLKK